MRYSLRQLEVFKAIAHHENVSKAAESLSMSQSAASSALKDLETQFDIQLFDRLGKKLQLNALGKQLIPRADALLCMAREIELDLLQHKDPGHLRLGASLTIGNYLAVQMMADYMSSFHGAHVGLDVANTTVISAMLERFELDLALVEGEVSHRDFQLIPWREDDLAIFCHPDHPFAKRKELTDHELLSLDWVVREQGSGTRQAFDRAMQDVLGQLRIRHELQHTEAIKRAVEAGLGVGCLSEITLKDAFARGSLVRLWAPQRNWHRRFYIVLHRQKYRTLGIEQWLQLCKRYAD